MPIIEPEVSIKSSERGDCDAILRAETLKALDALPEGEQVMLKLTLPDRAEPVRATGRPSARAARRRSCRAGSAARKRAASWRRTAASSPASAGRLLSDLRHQMSDDEFDGALGSAIDDIHSASVA